MGSSGKLPDLVSSTFTPASGDPHARGDRCLVHIEPGTPFDSRTRVVALTESTRAANAPLFPDGNVPSHAITMGIGTILESKAIVLLASGDKKRAAIERLRSGEIAEEFPASALWKHRDVTVLTA